MKFPRTLKRKCLVCGKSIKINILDKIGHYNNGHSFGKVKIPIKGTGEYKRVGTSKLLGKRINVVEWTGKEKEIEYWECNKCYEDAEHENWLEEIIEKLYDKRCKDYFAECPSCSAWNTFDTIIDENRGRL